jgi:pyruvate kinase
MSGVRINSSHASAAFHEQVVRASRSANPAGYIVYDIKGPKIRIGDLPEPLKLRAGLRLTLRTDLPKQPGSDYPRVDDCNQGIPITHADLHRVLKEGDRLLIDDGYIGLRVLGIHGPRIECEVMYGDTLRSRKGLNHPDTIVGYPYTMPQDIPDLSHARAMGVDCIADSFTRDSDDVGELRDRLKGSGIKIISKIENPEGVNNFDAILEATDAVMIARGDLGVELDPWLLPELQKVMIEKCNAAAKPVITATQMLESMMNNPHPNRADVSDIANAVYDGTDVLMLSGETSIGAFPEESVSIMRQVASAVESTGLYRAKKASVNGLKALVASRG